MTAHGRYTRNRKSKVSEILTQKITEAKTKKRRSFAIRLREGEQTIIAEEFDGIDVFIDHRQDHDGDWTPSFLLRHKGTGLLLLYFPGNYGESVFKVAITRDGPPPKHFRHRGRTIPLVEGQFTDCLIEEGGALLWRTKPEAHGMWGNDTYTDWRSLPTVPTDELGMEVDRIKDAEDRVDTPETQSDFHAGLDKIQEELK